MFSRHRPLVLPRPEEALPGRPEPILRPGTHAVLGRPIGEPYPAGLAIAEFALGCFWGAEKRFWQTPGVWVTAVGYAGGVTPNPTYDEVCTGLTGHAETVRVVYDPRQISYAELLRILWEAHDPTQGMRQGNDVGTQYRSVVFVRSEAERRLAEASKAAYEARLRAAGYGPITTEIVGPPPPTFFFAEEYHQQYLAKNPDGYCPDHSTGVSCPIGLGMAAAEVAESPPSERMSP